MSGGIVASSVYSMSATCSEKYYDCMGNFQPPNFLLPWKNRA